MADTGRGVVLELSLPEVRVERELKLFSAKEHVNTLALWPPGAPGGRPDRPSLWAVLHNLGDSKLAQIDLESGMVVRHLTRVGNKAHGLSLWRGAKAIMLSSGEGRLISVDVEAAIAEGDNYVPEVLWEDPEQTFMKGLVGACVLLTRRRVAR